MQFLGGDGGVLYLVHHIVDFTAKRVESGDGSPPLGGEEQKSVIKTASRGGGFLLNIVLRRHVSDCGIQFTSTRRARPF